MVYDAAGFEETLKNIQFGLRLFNWIIFDFVQIILSNIVVVFWCVGERCSSSSLRTSLSLVNSSLILSFKDERNFNALCISIIPFIQGIFNKSIIIIIDRKHYLNVHWYTSTGFHKNFNWFLQIDFSTEGKD